MCSVHRKLIFRSSHWLKVKVENYVQAETNHFCTLLSEFIKWIFLLHPVHSQSTGSRWRFILHHGNTVSWDFWRMFRRPVSVGDYTFNLRIHYHWQKTCHNCCGKAIAYVVLCLIYVECSPRMRSRCVGTPPRLQCVLACMQNRLT